MQHRWDLDSSERLRKPRGKNELIGYYKLFALGNQNAVTWVDTYKFISRCIMGTTVSVPVYD